MQLARAAWYHPGAGSLAWLQDLLAGERGRFPVWLPVFMGAGVLTYFALRTEPPLWFGAAVLLPATLAWFPARHLTALRLLLAPVVAAALGFTACQFATARAPPLEVDLPTRATSLTGSVRGLETLPHGRRVTLAAVRLDDSAEPLARLVRLRLRDTDETRLAIGDTMRVRALIRPPPPPAYPGAWDVQRDAFFAGIGAGGYALGTAERLSAGRPGGPMRLVQELRAAIERHILAVIPGAAGSIAVTLLTGSSRGIPEADHDAFRASGMAHLLSVSGLHIGIVMGFTMAVARLLLAVSERASLFWPTKQIAALAALVAGAGYMVLTGMHVPIVRSFCMASLFTLALMCGRRPASLRGLAVAGAVLILLGPQEVAGVSFQMSFSAVLALISGYETLRPWLRRLQGRSRPRRLGCYVLALALTSALAGTASAPFGAYHFGHVQVYFVFSNMLAVPLTALFVMPIGMLSLPLMPLGLDWLALRPMGWGVEAILAIARTTAALPAATLQVPHITAWGLASLAFGIAWLGLWRTRLRLAGLALIALGIASPAFDQPPDLLISADARLIAMRTGSGVFIQQVSGGARFTRDSWLQYWAAEAAQPIPRQGTAANGAFACRPEACLLHPRPGYRGVLLVRGATGPEDCRDISIIVSAEPARRRCPHPWPQLVDRFTVWRDGATAVWLQPLAARVLTDRAARGNRPWVPPPPHSHRRASPSLPPATIDGAD